MTAKALARAQRLLQRLRTSPEIIGILGRELNGERYERLVRDIATIFGEKTPIDVLRNSVADLQGVKLTLSSWYHIACRLAGNWHRLSAGHPVPPWTRQTRDEWIALEIEEIERLRTARGKLGFKLHCRALTGSCCPMRLETFWSNSFVAVVKSKLGVSKRHPYQYPSRHWSDLTGMRFEGMLTPVQCEEEPRFTTVRVPASLRQYNRELIDLRERRGFQCPEGYTHACFVCPIGTDRCTAATHPRTYYKRLCPQCKKQAWCDKRHRGMCVECRRHRAEQPQ